MAVSISTSLNIDDRLASVTVVGDNSGVVFIAAATIDDFALIAELNEVAVNTLSNVDQLLKLNLTTIIIALDSVKSSFTVRLCTDGINQVVASGENGQVKSVLATNGSDYKTESLLALVGSLLNVQFKTNLQAISEILNTLN